jgi:CubicO group peptidase (beta-lactamase class C family)
VDGSATFSGVYHAPSASIKGVWHENDTLHYPLTFEPARFDTIKGINPRTTNTYRYVQPPADDDGIQTANINDVGLRSDGVNALVRAVMENKFRYVHSVLVARNNRLVLEEYFYGFDPEAHFGIQSVTKSFVSALTGIAIEKKELPGVGERLCDLLPEYTDVLCNPQNRTITIRDVMNMSTGLKWDEVTYPYGHPKNSSMIAYESADPIRYLLSQPQTSKKEFAYNSYNHTLMSTVLRQATHLTNSDEYRQRLIEPLGITVYDLGESDDKGIIGDIFLRPRDMMKFGLLYLNDGVYNGKQLVPAWWIKESTSPAIMMEKDLGYGYFWWTKKFTYQERAVDCFFAWGYGGQFIFVIPELGLVVVLNGTNWSTDPKKYYFDLMENYVLKMVE